MAASTYYELLGIDVSAAPEEIKAAYRLISTKVHPDVGGSAALFRQVREAYETLSDPYLRSEYDEELKQGSETGSGRQTDSDREEAHRDRPRSSRSERTESSSKAKRADFAAPDPIDLSKFFRRNPSAAVILSGWFLLAVGTFLGWMFLILGWMAILAGATGLIGRRRGSSEVGGDRGREGLATMVEQFMAELREGLTWLAGTASSLGARARRIIRR